MTNAEKYVELVTDLYQLGEKESTKMCNNVPEIESELKKYSWHDIKTKVQYYFARKNDKSRPRLSQILALLETDPNVQAVEEEPTQDDAPRYNRPKTKIWSIMSTFNKLVNVLMDCGIIPDEHGEYRTAKSLVDPTTNEIVLNPRQWLQWRIEDTRDIRPDLFAKFPRATWLEELAICIENKLVSLQVRDWAKLAKNLPTDTRNSAEWHNYTKKTKTATQGA
jgi:hypothetical protein